MSRAHTPSLAQPTHPPIDLFARFYLLSCSQFSPPQALWFFRSLLTPCAHHLLRRIHHVTSHSLTQSHSHSPPSPHTHQQAVPTYPHIPNHPQPAPPNHQTRLLFTHFAHHKTRIQSLPIQFVLNQPPIYPLRNTPTHTLPSHNPPIPTHQITNHISIHQYTLPPSLCS